MPNTIHLLPEKIEDFAGPISLAFAKDGRVFLSERLTGHLWEIEGDKYRLLHRFPIVPLLEHHETGLLGITLDPDFENNGYIYCFYTTGTGLKDWRNQVVRITERSRNEEVILDNLPAGFIHNGGILTFGPDKCLYIGVGVQNEIQNKAQEISWLGGKILRINGDGSIPDDNPYANSPVFSYGHRNIFGLAFHPETGKLYACDVGPDHDDEIDVVEAGQNYGWPNVMGFSDDPNFKNPILTYKKVITPTQCVFAGNDLYFGSYNEGTVHKLTLDENDPTRVLKDEFVFQDKPYGIVGVFHDDLNNDFYVTTTTGVQRFVPKLVPPPSLLV